MPLSKRIGLLVPVFLLFLAGCGSEESNAVAGESVNVAAQAADAGSVEDDEYDDEDDADTGGLENFSSADMLKEMKDSCVTGGGMVFYPALDKANARQLCVCFYDEAFGKLSQAEWAEWINEWSWRGKLLADIGKGQKPDAATEARLESGNKKWSGIYAKSENYCIQKLGLKVEPVHREHE
ncbi:MAG: hypothetical protein LBJ59_12585 [Zoogloeaceae bacterium]|nr:hypothetical protein [Zoogloeaceae bacterium]